MQQHQERRKPNMGHCCFAGCEPRACGCCVRMILHKDSCPESTAERLRELRESADKQHTDVRDSQ